METHLVWEESRMKKKTKHSANQDKVLFHLKRLLHACLAVVLTIEDVSAPTEELKCLLNEKKKFTLVVTVFIFLLLCFVITQLFAGS